MLGPAKYALEYATPVKSMKCVNLTLSSMKWWYRGTESPAPSPNGKIIPAKAIVALNLAFRLMMAASISKPTKKRNKQRPILATRLRYGIESGVKTC